MLTSFFLDSADVYRPYTVSLSLCVLYSLPYITLDATLFPEGDSHKLVNV